MRKLLWKKTCIMTQRNAMDDYDAKLYLLSTNDGRIPCSQILKLNLDDIFRIKPKKRGSARSIKVMTCKVPSCKLTNVDMIRCSVCLKFSCEQCNSVQVTQVKQIMEKCSRIHFGCNNCNESEFVSNHVTENMKSVGTESNEIHTNFTISVDKKIVL